MAKGPMGPIALGALLFAAHIAVAAEPQAPPQPVSCAGVWEGRLLDCEEDRDVTMKFLMVNQGDIEKCASDSRNCSQEFIVLCEDYWSEEHATSHALLRVDTKAPSDQLSPDFLRENGYYLTLRVHRDGNCDLEPFEDSFWSDCEAWDCPHDCCEEYSPYKGLGDGRDVPLAEMKPLGEIPCFVFDPALAAQAAQIRSAGEPQ